jgi:3-phosphoshikimate 1-carboxyvinyltransferase
VIEVEVGELISKPYVEITLNLMARFGVQVERDGWRASSCRPAHATAARARAVVEGDASSASYFLAAGAIGGGPVRVEGVGRDSSIQGDVRFAEALEQWARASPWATTGSRRARRQAASACLRSGLNHIPDAAMTLAVAALFADGPCRLRNIASWRVKETDRIAAMATELRKLGATVEEGADYLVMLRPQTDAGRRSTPTTTTAWRCASRWPPGRRAGAHQRPGLREQDLPGYFDAFAGPGVPVIAIDGPSASGKGTVARAWPRRSAGTTSTAARCIA